MEIFELNSARINEILYSMENQEKDSYTDVVSGKIEFYDKGVIPGDDNLFPIPTWGPIEGFRVMDEFVSNMKNPLLKQELKIVLNSGQGVFRKFKNVLKEHPDIQKLWFSYKKKEMKALILSWYNQIREVAGLDILGDDEIDDESDLLVFDFTLEKGTKEDLAFIYEQDKIGFYEAAKNYPNDVIQDLYERKREGLLRDELLSEDLLYVVKTPAGDNAGFIWCVDYTLGESFKVIEVLQIMVLPAYRGLGLGKKLLDIATQEFNKIAGKEFIINSSKNFWIQKHLESLGLKLETQELYFRG